MSFSFSSWWSTTEAEVMQVLAKIKAEEVVLAHDLSKALNWVVSNSGTIATDINTVVGYAALLGAQGNPAFMAAVEAANIAVKALNAVAQAHAAGNSTAVAVVNGVVAIKNANAAVAQATAAVANTAAPAAAAVKA